MFLRSYVFTFSGVRRNKIEPRKHPRNVSDASEKKETRHQRKVYSLQSGAAFKKRMDSRHISYAGFNSNCVITLTA